MHKHIRYMVKAILSICLASYCTFGHAKLASPKSNSNKQTGIASYYSDKFHGRRTASGERYNKDDLTTVHSHLPFGTVLRVTNLYNQRSVDVRVNDRNRHLHGRLLDLSKRAAKTLGFIDSGVAKVSYVIVQLGDG